MSNPLTTYSHLSQQKLEELVEHWRKEGKVANRRNFNNAGNATFKRQTNPYAERTLSHAAWLAGYNGDVRSATQIIKNWKESIRRAP